MTVPKTPFQEGEEAAAIPPGEGQPKCPYPEDDPRHDQWYEGFGDYTEFMIDYNGGLYDGDES